MKIEEIPDKSGKNTEKIQKPDKFPGNEIIISFK